MVKLLISFLTVLIIATSCSNKIIFTNEMYEKVKDADINVEKVQFFNSKRIVLEREVVDPEDVKVTSGEIKLKNGKYVEQVVIRRRTPGVCTNNISKRLMIAFELGDKKEIGFISGSGSQSTFDITPNSKVSFVSTYKYGNFDYYLKRGSYANLLVGKEGFYKLIKEKYVAKGRKVN